MTCVEAEDLAEHLDSAPRKNLMSVDPAQIRAVQALPAERLCADLTVVRTAAFYMEVIPATFRI